MTQGTEPAASISSALDAVGSLSWLSFLSLLGIAGLTVVGLFQVLKVTRQKSQPPVPPAMAALFWSRRFRISRWLKTWGAALILLSLFINATVAASLLESVLGFAWAGEAPKSGLDQVARYCRYAHDGLIPGFFAALVAFVAYLSGYAISSILHFAGASRVGEVLTDDAQGGRISEFFFQSEKNDWNVVLAGIGFAVQLALYMVFVMFSCCVRLIFTGGVLPPNQEFQLHVRRAIQHMGTEKYLLLAVLIATLLLFYLGLRKSRQLLSRALSVVNWTRDLYTQSRRIAVIPHILQSTGLLILVFLLHRMLMEQITGLDRMADVKAGADWLAMSFPFNGMVLSKLLWASCAFVAFVTAYLARTSLSFIVVRKAIQKSLTSKAREKKDR